MDELQVPQRYPISNNNQKVIKGDTNIDIATSDNFYRDPKSFGCFVGTHCVDQADLELAEIPVSGS